MEEMYFYHSFPIAFKDDKEKEITKGVEILESMVKMGLVLYPQLLKWDKYLESDKIAPHRIFQRRICFTFLKPNELSEHAKEYGSFALEFDDKNIRLMGAFPLFYVPHIKKEEKTKQYPSHIFLRRLLETLNILKSLKTNQPDLRDKISESLNGVRGLFSLLYPTEHHLDPPLKNYHLREWRITGNTIELFANLHNLNIKLTTFEKENLKKIDNKNFGSEMEIRGRKYIKADLCFKFYELFGKHILSYARRLIVPDEAIIDAKKIIEDGIKKQRPEVYSISEFQKLIC